MRVEGGEGTAEKRGKKNGGGRTKGRWAGGIQEVLSPGQEQARRLGRVLHNKPVGRIGRRAAAGREGMVGVWGRRKVKEERQGQEGRSKAMGSLLGRIKGAKK